MSAIVEVNFRIRDIRHTNEITLYHGGLDRLSTLFTNIIDVFENEANSKQYFNDDNLTYWFIRKDGVCRMVITAISYREYGKFLENSRKNKDLKRPAGAKIFEFQSEDRSEFDQVVEELQRVKRILDAAVAEMTAKRADAELKRNQENTRKLHEFLEGGFEAKTEAVMKAFFESFLDYFTRGYNHSGDEDVKEDKCLAVEEWRYNICYDYGKIIESIHGLATCSYIPGGAFTRASSCLVILPAFRYKPVFNVDMIPISELMLLLKKHRNVHGQYHLEDKLNDEELREVFLQLFMHCCFFKNIQVGFNTVTLDLETATEQYIAQAHEFLKFAVGTEKADEVMENFIELQHLDD